MRIGIYGGTFSPLHRGHLDIIQQSVSKLGLDKLLVVPASVPPHKQNKDIAPAEDRLAMLKIGLDVLFEEERQWRKKYPFHPEDKYLSELVEIDELELRREGPSYTSDTLRELKKRYPDDELYLIMGEDMFFSLDSWHEPGVICALANIAVYRRGVQGATNFTSYGTRDRKTALEEKYYAKVKLLDNYITAVSSTEIRTALKKGQKPEGLPDSVYGYILRNKLYGTDADLKKLPIDQLRICSLSMVYAKRHRHILGVEEEAVRLANLWGADPEDARRAGILHDCTKYLPLAEHLSLCEAGGLELDDMEKDSAKLLHSKSGAVTARYVYGQNDAVYDAIYWHTTGKADMSLLEKILYLADYMEPNRDFDGVEELRRLCYTDLDAALTLAFTMSVDDLKERHIAIHPNTQGALDWMLEHGKGH